jgi:uncharacterized protein YxjI
MNYPLTLTFKVIALAPQLSVTDANGQLVFYVRQKMFKLREAVTVFADREQKRPVTQIRADRILDFNAVYGFEDAQGRRFGAVRRAGMRSIWKAHYEVLRAETPVLTIREDSAFVRFMDSVIGDLPIVGLLSGYLFHPSYSATRADGTRVLHVKKQPALWEGRFTIEREAELTPDEEASAVLSILMMVLLERDRG